MTRHNRILLRLKNLAEDIDPTANARVVSAIFVAGKEIAIGVNISKSHPFQGQYSKHPEAILLHAEISAIRNALKRIDKEDLERATIYVARAKYASPAKSHMVAGLVRPCSGCQRALEAFKIKRVFFTGDDHDFSCDDPLTMES